MKDQVVKVYTDGFKDTGTFPNELDLIKLV